MSFLTYLRKTKKMSERDLAAKVNIARATLRSYERDLNSGKTENLQRIADALGHQLLVAVVPLQPALSELSIVGVSLAISRDGFASWKIHVFNFVDHFRKTKDFRLVILPPVSHLDVKLQALLAAIVCTLCDEIEQTPPDWSREEMFLATPWFVAGMESLKASGLLETPLAYRRNNIFVTTNFLERA